MDEDAELVPRGSKQVTRQGQGPNAEGGGRRKEREPYKDLKVVGVGRSGR